MRTTLINTRTARTAVAALATALTLAACGGASDDATAGAGGSGAGSSSVEASPVPGIDAEHNDADMAFITDMKPHHDGALAMAQLAEGRAENPQVKDLAQRIVAAQDPEIQLMQKMATAWGVDLEAGGGMDMGGASASPGMDMGGGMDMEADTAALEPLSGAAFDREFLTRMTAHHRSAVEMAKVELAEGQNAQAKDLAQDIITSQTAEIEEMTKLLAAL